jgi:enoyl-CoA hydratase
MIVGTLQYLSRIVGSGVARHLALSGNKFSAQEALRVGLVTQIFEDQSALLAGFFVYYYYLSGLRHFVRPSD